MRVGRGEDDITGDLGVDDLGDNVLVGEADDEAVLWRVVLVLRLGHEALSGIVIGLSLSLGTDNGGCQRAAPGAFMGPPRLSLSVRAHEEVGVEEIR